MHPDYTLDIAGKCPRCGMALVRAAPFDVRDYGLEFTTEPAVVQAGTAGDAGASASLTRAPANAIKKFEIVHERQYHLFVISQDMDSLPAHPPRAAGRTARGSST